MHAAARPGGNRLPEYDAIAALGGDTPHYGYPLRNVGEANFQIKLHRDADSFGEMSQLQALRECYPGATYLHLAGAYEVTAWHTRSLADGSFHSRETWSTGQIDESKNHNMDQCWSDFSGSFGKPCSEKRKRLSS